MMYGLWPLFLGFLIKYVQELLKVPRANVKVMHVSSRDGVADMTHLADLSEGSLLRNLRLRYEKDTIYVRRTH